MADLPAPTSHRWQPQRLGLVDLFYYDDEVIPFKDGRLLLRGNNGTGKSKVLALTLPFLLDADLSPRRVEPDADPNKRMEWNLLLGGAHPHSERLGYAWLEFGHIDEHGEPHFCTLGAALKAVSGRGMARHWFFITERRVGGDLQLLDASRTVLGRERLAEAIGDRGRIFDGKRDYRRAVDEKLFGLGERRYEALMSLLIQLRQPQLSKRPNERALSDALTEALSPVRGDLVEYVAEGFRGLDDERQQLEELLDAARAAEAFLEHYREYARVISRRRAEGPRLAHSRYESLGRELARIREEAAASRAAVVAAQERVASLRRLAATLTAEYEALFEGEHADGEAQLAAADREATAARDRAEEAGAARDRAASEAAEAAEALVQATAKVQGEAADRDRSAEVAAAAAEAADLEARHRELVMGAEATLADRQRRAAELLRRRRQALTRVRDLIRAKDEAERVSSSARARLDDATSALDLAAARFDEKGAVRERSATAWVAAVRNHLDGLTEIGLHDADALALELRTWSSTLEGPNPVALALAEAAERVRADIAGARASASSLAAELDARANDLEQEIADLQAGRTEPPPVRHTRRASGLPGVPLWRLVDFAPEVGRDHRARLEAALEAAGLLDAHLLPDGVVRAADDGEVLLWASEANQERQRGASRATLASVLRVTVPQDASGVRAEDVAAVLRSIEVAPAGEALPPASGSGPIVVSPDGRFRLGVATGAWSKGEASYIGDSAREAARRRRVDEARQEIADARAERREVAGTLDRLEQRRSRLRDEVERLPSDIELRDAHADVEAAKRSVDDARDARTEASLIADEKQAVAERHAAELAQEAELLNLPATFADLERVEGATHEYASALQDLWHAMHTVEREEGRRNAVLVEHERAEARNEAAEESSRRRDEELEAAAARLRVLDSTIGVEVREFQRRRSDVTRRRGRAAEDLEAAREALNGARIAVARAEERKATKEEQQEAATQRRDETAAALRRTSALGLVAIALPERTLPDPEDAWTPSVAIGLARTLEGELAGTNADDAAWERVQARLSTEFHALQSALGRHGHSAVGEPSDDGYSVSVVFAGKTTPIADLVAKLREDTEARQRLLTAREREIIENHLVTEVGANLADLVSEAESQLRALNAELSERPTSTGMKLRVVWKPLRDGPPGLAEARRRLLQLSDAWSEEDRKAIGAFLQHRIADVRESNESGTWYEQLEEALDYRGWHHFSVERYQNGAWRPATGPASGGERVLAVSIPLFAAASSHYRTSANPHAARLVVLDEAFAGVDDDSRAKSLGLLAAFDLDVAMTSEREWGCYREVPGLSIAQLSRVEGIPAVLVTLWEWDGGARKRVQRHKHHEDAPAEAGLWA